MLFSKKQILFFSWQQKSKILFYLMFFGLMNLGLMHYTTSDTSDPKIQKQEAILANSPLTDSILSGVPLLIEGQKWDSDSFTIPTIVYPKVKQTIVPSPPKYLAQSLPAFPFPQPDSMLTVGKNGVPLPNKLAAQPQKVSAKIAQLQNILSFQKGTPSSNKFQFLNSSQGLPNSGVKGIFEDSQNTIWIEGEEWFIQYLGQSFRPFGLNEGLVSTQVHELCEDQQGNLWFSYEENIGFAKFDGQYFWNYLQANPSYSIRIQNMTLDENGQLWMFAKYITFTDFIQDYEFIKFDGNDFFIYSFSDFNLKKEFDGIYLKSKEYVYFMDGQSFTTFDGKRFLHYKLPDTTAVLIHNKSANTAEMCLAFQDKICFKVEDNLQCITIEKFKKHPIQKVFYNDKNDFYTFHKNDLFSHYDGKYFTFFSEENGYQAHFQPQLKDQVGNVWFNSQGEGIQRFKEGHFKQEAILQNGLVSAILEDNKGNIWLGEHHPRLAKWTENIYTEYTEIFKTGSVIRSLYQDSQGNVWIGSNTLFKFDGQRFFKYSIPTYQDKSMIFGITEDRQGNIWFGGNGLWLTKFDGRSFTQFPDKNPIPKNYIRTLIRDNSGNIWMAKNRGGLIKYDGQFFTHFTEKEGLTNNEVVALKEDSKGNIWIGTKGGLSKYDGQIFTNYSTQNGLSHNNVWTIIEDDKGNIWLGVDACLNVILLEEKAQQLAKDKQQEFPPIAVYCDFDGWKSSEFFANTGIRDSKGQLWWGTFQYTLCLPPDKSPLFLEPLPTRLNEVKIAETFIDFQILQDSIQTKKDCWVGKDKDINMSEIEFSSTKPFFNYPLDLRLPHHINNIAFEYSAPSYPREQALQYSYFMEGLDKNWSVPNAQNKTEYKGLPVGTYTFKAKARGNERIWGPPFAYTFTILPPWWQTWWAYLIWIAFLTTAIYWIYRFNLTRSLKLQEAERIKELDTIKSRFYTNITHEFRTPLTVILGINDTIKGHQQERSLIQTNAQNLLRLINQLLDLSKMESHQLKLNFTHGNIINYMQYLCESFHSAATDKGITLAFYTEVEHLKMDYDEAKVQHIVYNLLSNALKFTPEYGKIIFHVTQEDTLKQSFLKMKIKDNGIGISDVHLPHIFDRFYQVDDSSVRKGEGTGIGLALTKELIELMKGSIQVKSVEQIGTTFIVKLPIENNIQQIKERPQKEFNFPLSKAESAGVPSNLSPISSKLSKDLPELLIIEDNKDVVIYIKTLLQKDYQIQTAKNGKLGIEKAIELVPDLIISDVMMPEKNGFEVCETLKQDERTSHIPIILLTAKATMEDKIHGLKHGADAYLTKPFHKEELIIRLDKILELRQKLQQKYASNPPISTDKSPSLEEIFIQKLQAIIAENYDNHQFGVTELAEAVHLSHTQVYRKLKALMGKTPSQFIRSFRLQKGRELLQNSDLNISEVAYEVGFADPNYFSRMFQKEFGKSPREFK